MPVVYSQPASRRRLEEYAEPEMMNVNATGYYDLAWKKSCKGSRNKERRNEGY
jgi:hypothetical protein